MSDTTRRVPPMPIDVLDPRFYDDPWDAYRWLRHEAPVWWDPANELWVVSRHADVSHVSRHDETYSAAQGVRPRLAAPMSIIAMDDPEHTRQRRLVSKGFTPRMVRQMSDHIRELSRQIIAGVADRGECDFVEDLAIHVPLIVIAEIMGLPPEHRHRLYRWSDDMMAGDGHMDADDPVLQKAATAFGEFAEMCSSIIADRRATGATDDVIGVLTNAFDEGRLERPTAGMADGVEPVQELTSDELMMFLVLVVVAGNETTRNALTGGLQAFSRFPAERQRLLEHPELIDTAVDEILRFVSPVLSFSRTVTTDHELHGAPLKAGDKVMMLYQSANRDETVFDDPDEFRIDRNPNPHLALGIGTHYCMGSNLARTEIKVVFEELLASLSDIRAADPTAPFDRGDSALVLSLRHLPVEFTPAAPHVPAHA
jgi:cytochrome P450 family 142 subfamily A polypeptide 1